MSRWAELRAHIVQTRHTSLRPQNAKGKRSRNAQIDYLKFFPTFLAKLRAIFAYLIREESRST